MIHRRRGRVSWKGLPSALAVLGLFAGVASAAPAAREGMLFSKLAGDARLSALGSPGTALAEGPSAMFANPAAAVLQRELAAGLTHLSWPLGFYGETLSFQKPVGLDGVAGASLFLFMHSAVQETSALLPDGTGGMIDLYDGVLTITGSQWATDTFAFGVSARALFEKIGTTLTMGMALDLGVLWAAYPDLTFGATARGLGRIIRAQKARDPMPNGLSLGARYEIPGLPLRVYAGGTLAGYGPGSGGLAVEAGEFYGLSVRGMLEGVETGNLRGAFGLGARRDMWAVDYAFSPVAVLGYAHRISLGLRFGLRPKVTADREGLRGQAASGVYAPEPVPAPMATVLQMEAQGGPVTAPVRKISLAVGEFVAQNTTREEADALVERLTRALERRVELAVIPVREVAAARAAEEFAKGGCVSEECAARLGAKLAAEHVVVGSLVLTPEQYTFNARLVDVQTGKLLFADSVQGVSIGKVEEGLAVLAESIAKRK
jgi:TolB-like protein